MQSGFATMQIYKKSGIEIELYGKWNLARMLNTA